MNRAMLPLLTLGVLVLVCFIVATRMQIASRQQQSVAKVERLHGVAWYDYESNGPGFPEYEKPLSEPQFLLRWFGADFFHPVVGVSFSTGNLRDFVPTTRISENDLSCLDGLVNLRVLDVRQQPIGDNALARLRKFSKLEKLDMAGTRVTDAGLKFLGGSSQLQRLDVSCTQVTAAGVKRFQHALPNCKVIWEPPAKNERQSPAAPDQLR